MLENGVHLEAFGAHMKATAASGSFSHRLRATCFAVISEADWPAIGITGAPSHLVDCQRDPLFALCALLAALLVPLRLLHIKGTFALTSGLDLLCSWL